MVGGNSMFSANKANSLMNKVREGRVTYWQKLQFEIRERAMKGYDFLYLTNVNYLNLVTSLQVNGYDVAYDKEAGLWYCSWSN